MRAIAALAATMLATVSCGAHSTATSDKTRLAPQRIRTALVRSIAFSTPLDVSGTIAASQQATVGAVAAGRVVAVYVRTGDAVVAGQPLARIDDAAFRAGFAQARGSATAARAAVVRARADAASGQARLQLAEVTARRMRTLYRQGAISAQQNDEAQADVTSARAVAAQARAGIAEAVGSEDAATAAVAAAAVPLDEVHVRAPFDGVVLTRAVDPGAVVGAGSAIATIEDNAHLEVDVAVPEAAVSAVHAGMPLTVRVDALGGKTIAGRVRAIIASSDPMLRTATVKIDLANSNGLLAGMFARVSFVGPAHRARAVPAAALVERAGQRGVFAIADGHATFIPVQTGATQGGWLEAADLPLHVHEVAIDGVSGLNDGAAVATAR